MNESVLNSSLLSLIVLFVQEINTKPTAVPGHDLVASSAPTLLRVETKLEYTIV